MLPEQQQRILGYFIEEARDHLNTIEQGLLNLQSTLNDPEMINEVFRAAHSIKGGAAMLGLSSIQRTSHRLEDCFKVLKENPITVDQKLESLFLGVSDTLKALLEHLSGPFGLSEEAASTLMSEAEPVFGWLNEHLESLLSTTGATNIKVSTLHEPEQVPVINTSVPSAIDWQQFQNQVLQKLRDMLQLFKQDATTASRKGLSACCEYLAVIGNDLKLTNWCHLCKGAARAVENPDNSYLTLAKVIITEIKAAQELVLAGRDSEITISPQLEVLISLPDIELLELSSDFFENDVLEVNVHPDKVESLSVHDFHVLDTVENVDRTDNLFHVSFDDINSSTQGYDVDDIGLFDLSSGFDIDEKDFNEKNISLESDDEDDTIESLFELTEEFEYVDNFDVDIENNDDINVEREIDDKIESLLDLDSEISSEISSDMNGGAVDDKINSPFEMSELLETKALFLGTTNITQYHPGPEVGIAELSELSELFKDEIYVLDDTWHSEPVPTISVEHEEHSTDNFVNDSELDDLLVFEDSTNFYERPERSQGELTVVQLFGSSLDEEEDDVSSYDSLDSELPEVTTDSNVIYLDEVSSDEVTLFEDVSDYVSLDDLLSEEPDISSLDEIDDIFATDVDVSAPVWELPEVTDDDFASFWIESQTTDVTSQLEQSLFAATYSDDIFSDILDLSVTQVIEDVVSDDSDNIELALEEVPDGAVDEVEDAFVLESAPVDELESKLPDNIEEFDGVDLSSDEFTALEALLGNNVTPSSVIEASNNDVVENALGSDVDNNNIDVLEFGDLEKMLFVASDNIPGASKRDKGVSSRAATRRTARFEQLMKVPVKHLDDMSNLVGELVVNRNTLEQDQERLRQSLDNLLIQIHHLSDVGARMQELYERSLLEASLLATRKYGVGGGNSGAVSNKDTERGFSELEMDRFTPFHTLSQEMIELIVRVRESASDIDFVTEETERVARQFRQVTTQLQEGLTRARMVPFSIVTDRVKRGVRDNAIKCGKQVELVIEGQDTLIDKMILEHLTDPLIHMLNNAIAHGIETPEERVSKGKQPVGIITVRAFHQGNQTVLSVSDDGAGINTDYVKQKAILVGLITPEQATTISRMEVYELLFQPNFTTKDKVDDLAGRGVGMDVVRTSISEIRGTINTDSTIGKGTSFTIRLPLTLSICKALCCVWDKARIAFPMDGVEDTLDIPVKSIQKNKDGELYIVWRDMQLPFKPLKELLTLNRHLSRGSVYGGTRDDDMVSVVVIRSASTLIGLQVDAVLSEQEIVIKQFEGPAPKPLGVAGATVLGDGRIMPIADVLEIIDIFQGRTAFRSPVPFFDATPNGTESTGAPIDPTVLIVDDSITVRELLSLSFNKAGYRVEQARDGQEAWEKLRSGLPCDIVFCDIEMPRCDGLELLSRISKEPSLSQLPIAMLTSRGADKHKTLAINLGASGYFTKPYLEEALLEAAARMLKGEKLVSPNG